MENALLPESSSLKGNTEPIVPEGEVGAAGTPPPPPDPPAPPARPHRRRRRFAAAVTFGVFSGVALGITFAALSDLPALAKLEDYTPPSATRVLDREGRLIVDIGIDVREPVTSDQIPEGVKLALVATEDARFYRHHGVDFLGLFRAVVKKLMGQRLRGTSTLTQQLAKNLFLTPERSLMRKLKEAGLAFQIERKYTKDQILTLYLNQVYLGAGTSGVEAASKRYFGKSVKDLDLAQQAMLAGLPQSPSGYEPFKYPERALTRRNIVLGRMRDVGYITEQDCEKWRAEPLGVLPAPVKIAGGKAPYFVAWLTPELYSRFGEEAVRHSGLQVWTTIDLDAQAAAEAALVSGLAAVRARQADYLRRNAGKPGIPTVDAAEKPQGAIIAIDPATGDVRALVGGSAWQTTQFNRALQSKRQPGSSFKPIVYAAAIEAGWTQASAVWDAPMSYTDRSTGKVWAPKNYYDGNLGRITMRTALEQSSNGASIYLLEHIGVGSAVDEARRLGITSPLSPNLTLALGSSDMTLAEITRAYAAFANGGVRTDHRALTKVLDRNGRPLYVAPPTSGRAVMKPEVAYVVSDLLRGVTTHGLSKKVGDGVPFWVGGKTGTTNRSTDSLFVGFSSTLAAGVWIGMDSHAPMPWGESGGRAAQPIFLEFMAKAGPRFDPAVELPMPAGVVRVDVDPVTGLIATEGCAEKLSVAFVAGTEPKRECPEDSAVGGDARYSLDVAWGQDDEPAPLAPSPSP